MSLTLDLEELLNYSDHERAKWRQWLTADRSRSQIPFQPGGRFPTIGAIFDHVFLVERRHLARLEGGTPPDMTGVANGDLEALFEYATLVRADMRRYVADLDERSGAETISFTVQSAPGGVQMTRRKLIVHMVLHEVRHLAQAAYATRCAGQAPPGEHDYFYCPEAVVSSQF
jgi:uncharacterized damage-inducible protein DinB